jgi:hypothetical protein
MSDQRLEQRDSPLKNQVSNNLQFFDLSDSAYPVTKGNNYIKKVRAYPSRMGRYSQGSMPSLSVQPPMASQGSIASVAPVASAASQGSTAVSPSQGSIASVAYIASMASKGTMNYIQRPAIEAYPFLPSMASQGTLAGFNNALLPSPAPSQGSVASVASIASHAAVMNTASAGSIASVAAIEPILGYVQEYWNEFSTLEYESPLIPIVLGGSVTLLHTLSNRPTFIEAFLKLKPAVSDLGYTNEAEVSLGDYQPNSNFNQDRGIAVWTENNTEIELRFGTTAIRILDAVAGTSNSDINIANWDVIIRAK